MRFEGENGIKFLFQILNLRESEIWNFGTNPADQDQSVLEFYAYGRLKWNRKWNVFPPQRLGFCERNNLWKHNITTLDLTDMEFYKSIQPSDKKKKFCLSLSSPS